MKRKQHSWPSFLILILIVLLMFSMTVFSQSLTEYNGQIEQNMVATYNQTPNNTVNMAAGGYSITLASPVSPSIPNLGFELISAKSPVLGYETSITSFSAAENTSQQMEVMVYFENNGTLCTTGHGSIISLSSNGGQYPIKKLVAQYSTGVFKIADQYLKYGINASLYYNRDYDELAYEGYGLDNVLSAYNFSITPRYGETDSTLSLQSQYQNSGLQIFFSPKYYATLNDGNEFINVTDKEVSIYYFSDVSVNFVTFPESNFTIPYFSISSVNLNLMSSSLDYMNGTNGAITVIGENGISYDSTDNFSIQARTPILFNVNEYITNSQLNLRYFISAGFSQVYVDGSALFHATAQYIDNPLYRKSIALMEGGLMGAFLTLVITEAKELKSKRFSKSNQSTKRMRRKND